MTKASNDVGHDSAKYDDFKFSDIELLFLLFVNIHTHDGRFVFHYSRIYFRISCHRSFLHMFEDSSVQKSRVCILIISII